MDVMCQGIPMDVMCQGIMCQGIPMDVMCQGIPMDVMCQGIPMDQGISMDVMGCKCQMYHGCHGMYQVSVHGVHGYMNTWGPIHGWVQGHRNIFQSGAANPLSMMFRFLILCQTNI